MPALNFQERFAADVESGRKRQTIRLVRKRPIRVGDTLYLYTGMRTKACRKLGVAICGKICRIRITTYGISFEGDRHEILNPGMIAKNDGFMNWFDMRDWFDKQYGLSFTGVLIRWEPERAINQNEEEEQG